MSYIFNIHETYICFQYYQYNQQEGLFFLLKLHLKVCETVNKLKKTIQTGKPEQSNRYKNQVTNNTSELLYVYVFVCFQHHQEE